MTKEKLDAVLSAVQKIVETQDDSLLVSLDPQGELGNVDYVNVTLTWPKGIREFEVDVWGDGPLWMAKDLLKAIDNKM